MGRKGRQGGWRGGEIEWEARERARTRTASERAAHSGREARASGGTGIAEKSRCGGGGGSTTREQTGTQGLCPIAEGLIADSHATLQCGSPCMCGPYNNNSLAQRHHPSRPHRQVGGLSPAHRLGLRLELPSSLVAKRLLVRLFLRASGLRRRQQGHMWGRAGS